MVCHRFVTSLEFYIVQLTVFGKLSLSLYGSSNCVCETEIIIMLSVSYFLERQTHTLTNPTPKSTLLSTMSIEPLTYWMIDKETSD